jgi:hypothetical protein
VSTYPDFTGAAQKLLDQQTEINRLKFELQRVTIERNVAERRLAALDNAGVDNWEGYSHAMALLANYEREAQA